VTGVHGPCPGCGAASRTPIRTYRCTRPVPLFADRAVVRCDACGLGAAHPMPSQAELDAYYAAGSYDVGNPALADATSRWERLPRRADAQARLVTQVRERPGSWLDIGAGYGLLLEAARSRGVERVAAIEATPARRRSLEERGMEVFEDLAQAHGAGPFDVVSFSHVLEHVADPVAFVREAATVLGPDGIVLCEVPNAMAWSGAHDDPHVTFFSPGSLEQLLRRAGLVPLKVVTAGTVTSHPPVMRGLSTRWWEVLGERGAPEALAGLHPDYRERGSNRVVIRALATIAG
jgi:SAM-dependent methyltransferase